MCQNGLLMLHLPILPKKCQKIFIENCCLSLLLRIFSVYLFHLLTKGKASCSGYSITF